MKYLYQLPDNPYVTVDDGACDHLEGMLLPSLLLKTTSNGSGSMVSRMVNITSNTWANSRISPVEVPIHYFVTEPQL